MLTLSNAEMMALVTGESVVAFVDRRTVDEGDELELDGGGSRADAELKPAYRRWADVPTPHGEWTAVVESIDPAAILDPVAGSSRHILAEAGTGDLVVLRVYGDDGPVLSDTAFAARRRSVEGALGQ